MKKQIKIIYNILMIISILSSLNLIVFAENNKTEAQVEFVTGVGPTVPVDPEDPDTEDPGGGSVEGALAIVNVSYFDFGTNLPVEAIDRKYNIKTEQPNIQIVDLRGSGTGWRVSAKVSNFVDDDLRPSLPGAQINITNSRPNSNSVSMPPVQLSPVELTTDGETVPVLKAAEGAGTGLWVMRWYPPENEGGFYINLEVPAGSASVGNHTAEINWILEDTPSVIQS